MKLKTSRILAQLSEQDRNKVEMELAELNGHSLRLAEQKNISLARISQLNQQRDQALKNRNAAALLQTFNLSLQEQQCILHDTGLAMLELDQQKQDLLSRFAEIYRSQQAYEGMHDKQQLQQRRHEEQKSQRQMDDLMAARRQQASI